MLISVYSYFVMHGTHSNNYQSRSSVHPSLITKPEWVLSRKIIHTPGLVVEYRRAEASELEPPPLTQHLFPVFFSDGARHHTRIEDLSYEGKQQAGDVWLLPAGSSGHFRWDDPGELLMFILDPQFLRQVSLETECINPDKVELRPTLYKQDSTLKALAHSFHYEMQHNLLGGKLYIEALANQLAIHLLREYCVLAPKMQPLKGGLSQKKLYQVIDYIQINIHQELSLAIIAQEIGINQSYFCTLFKQSTGITPYQYILQQRIERAKQLLKQPHIAIVDVAIQCGFANQSHFTKHFRQLTGITPKVYQEQA